MKEQVFCKRFFGILRLGTIQCAPLKTGQKNTVAWMSKDQLQERWPDTASTSSANFLLTCLLPFKKGIWLLNKTRKEQQQKNRKTVCTGGRCWGAEASWRLELQSLRLAKELTTCARFLATWQSIEVSCSG